MKQHAESFHADAFVRAYAVRERHTSTGYILPKAVAGVLKYPAHYCYDPLLRLRVGQGGVRKCTTGVDGSPPRVRRVVVPTVVPPDRRRTLPDNHPRVRRKRRPRGELIMFTRPRPFVSCTSPCGETDRQRAKQLGRVNVTFRPVSAVS